MILPQQSSIVCIGFDDTELNSFEYIFLKICDLYIRCNYKDEPVFTKCIKNKDKAVCLGVSWMEWMKQFNLYDWGKMNVTYVFWQKNKKLLGGEKVSKE